ncbi:hypothetical protein IWW38_004424, partial [Coemansia aciculifera]
DMAILRCCNAPMFHETDVASVFKSNLFDTPEFGRYCEKMQVEAAEEIRCLRRDLDMAVADGERYGGGVRRDARMESYATGRSNDAFGHGVTPSPMLPQRQVRKGSMMPPDSLDGESFSPTISPSPPTVQHPRAMSHNLPAPFTESPRGIDMYRQRMPLHQSHSLPTRQLDGLADNYIGAGSPGSPNGPSAAGLFSVTGGDLTLSAKRRQPEVDSVQYSLLHNVKAKSPRGNGQQLLHSPRLSKTPPKPAGSPISNTSFGSSSYRAGPPAGAGAADMTMLPPISHIVQSVSGTMPLPIGNPSQGRPATYEQYLGHYHHRLAAASRRQNAADPPHLFPSSLQRSSGSIGEEGGMGDTTVTGRDELSRSELDQIGILREENAYLRRRMRDLEMSVTQRQAEMQNWMGRMEQHIMRTGERSQ